MINNKARLTLDEIRLPPSRFPEGLGSEGFAASVPVSCRAALPAAKAFLKSLAPHTLYAGNKLHRGQRLHTRNHKSELPLENATENPLGISSQIPLGK